MRGRFTPRLTHPLGPARASGGGRPARARPQQRRATGSCPRSHPGPGVPLPGTEPLRAQGEKKLPKPCKYANTRGRRRERGRLGTVVPGPGEQPSKETSRPHPFKGPLEQRLPGPRGVGLARQPAARPARRASAPARPAGARTGRGGALQPRGPTPAPLTRLAAAAPGGDGTGREGGLGAPGRGGRGALASPTVSLFSAEVTARGGASGAPRRHGHSRPRNFLQPAARPAASSPAPRPCPPRAPHLRRRRLRRRRPGAGSSAA